MARRKLIGGSGCVRLVAQGGSGWVNCTLPEDTNPYPLVLRGTMRVTVTATGCGGVQLHDWDGAGYAEHVAAGGLHTLTGIVTGRRGPVIRVLNPTSETEIIVNYEILNPPPPLHKALVALVGVVLNGTQKSHRPGAVRRAQAGVVGDQCKGRDSGRAWAKGHGGDVLAPRRCAPADYRLRRGQVDVALSQKSPAVWHGRAARGPHRPCGDGRTRANRHVRVHRNTGYAAACGCDYRPDTCLTTAFAAGGGWRKWRAGNSTRRKPSAGTSSPQPKPGTWSPSLCRVSRRIGGGTCPPGGSRGRQSGLRRWRPRTHHWGRACASTPPASQTCWVPQMRLGGPSPTYADGGGVGGAQENRRHAAAHRPGVENREARRANHLFHEWDARRCRGDNPRRVETIGNHGGSYHGGPGRCGGYSAVGGGVAVGACGGAARHGEVLRTGDVGRVGAVV